MDECRDIFISYHTNSSADIVHKLSLALEGAGLSCWFAPRDCSNEYASTIVHAIKSSKMLLLVLNDKSNESKHCLNEINIAFNQGISILPIRISEVNLSDDMYYYIGRIHIMNGGVPPELLKIQEIIERCRQILGKNSSISADVKQEGVTKTANFGLVSSLSYPDSRFVGRKKELEAIAEQLSGMDNKLFLSGMGGIGKSEIAKMYLKQNAEKYKVVLWVPFTENLVHTLGSDSAFPIEGISRTSHTSDSDEDYALRKMDILKKIANRQVLIIIDNFDVEDDPYLDRFLSGTYGVLFTTRIRHEGRNEIAILPMQDEKDLVALFKTEYTRAITSEEENTVRKIIQYLDGHTLSIRLIASAMQKRRIKPVKMLKMLKDEDSANLKTDKKLSEQIFGRLKTVFRLSTLTEEELHLLMNLSLISNAGIDVSTLYEWCELSDYDLIDNLIARSWIIYDDVQDIVHLHPLIAELMLEELQKHPEACETMLKNYYENNKWNVEYPIKIRAANYERAQTMWERLPQNAPHRYDILLLKISMTQSLSLYQATFEDCRELIRNAQKLEHSLFGYAKLSHGLCLSGDNRESLKVAKEGEKIMDGVDIDGLNDFEFLQFKSILGRISEASDHLGDPETAYNTQLKVYKMDERDLHQSLNLSREGALGWAEFHLTHCLYHLGRYEEALEMTYKSLRHFEECDSTWSMCFSYWHLAILLAKKGQYDEAEECIQKSLDNLIPIIGQDNVDIAKTLHYQAHVRVFAHNAQKAAESLEAARQIYEKLGFTTYVEIVDKELQLLQEGKFWEPDIFIVSE